MPRKLLLPLLLLCATPLPAQIWNNVRLNLEAGFPINTASDNLGLLFNLEPCLQVSHHLVLGMRMAVAVNSQTFSNADVTQFIIDERFDHGFLSVVPTVEYSWEIDAYRPFVGVGFGPYSLANTVDVARVRVVNPAEEFFPVDIDYQLGLLLRGGVAWRKARFTLEYNYVPTQPVTSANDNNIGTVNSSYFGVLVGWVIGRKSSTTEEGGY